MSVSNATWYIPDHMPVCVSNATWYIPDHMSVCVSNATWYIPDHMPVCISNAAWYIPDHMPVCTFLVFKDFFLWFRLFLLYSGISFYIHHDIRDLLLTKFSSLSFNSITSSLGA